MKNYKIEFRKTPILEKCSCDVCKKDFIHREDELITILFHLCDKDHPYYSNIVHGEYCPECLHEMIKNKCRYNYDLGFDYDKNEAIKDFQTDKE